MVVSGKIYRITSTSDCYFFILHSAIVFEYRDIRYVLHMTFDGIEVVPYETFMRKRRLIYAKEYTLRHNVNIDDVLKEKANDRFNLIYNNCENFTNDFVSRHTFSHGFIISQQIAFWCITLVVLILIALHKTKRI